LDIIGFQEVRSTGAGGTSNQVEELRSAAALTGHTVVFQPCHQVGKPKGKEIEGPETWEGLALLSRLPILSHAMVVLPKSDRWSTDNNQRCALRVTLDVSSVAPGLGGLQVFVTHLSYADTQQCLNTAALLYWMNEELVRGAGIDGERMVAQVLMGDLNTYFGYEWPLEIMLREKNDPLKLHTLNPCTAVQTEPQLLRELSPTRVLLPATSVPPFAEWPSHHQEASALRDAWTALFAENKPGFTFSNVGDVTKLYDDNPPCRADRILVRGPIFPVAARTIGRDPLSLFVTPPSEEVLLSDHLGVAVMLALATSEVAASQAQVRVLKSRRDIEEGQKRVTDADKRLHDRAAELLVVVNEDHVATESGDESKMVISRNKVKHAKRQHSTEMSALEREKENYQSILQNLIPP
jgi:endonuclease/exonuclease/phosphatase family metal-dependent hydrolase